MSTSQQELSDDLVAQLRDVLAHEEPTAIGRSMAQLLDKESGSLAGVERILRDLLLSEQRTDRSSAAAAFQAIPAVWSNGQRMSAASESVEAIIAALVVETELSVRLELLSALARQDYEQPPLKRHAPLAALIAKRTIEAPVDVDEETDNELRFLYQRLRAELVDESERPLGRRAARRIVGYAATGIPFILSDRQRPKVVLIYNSNLDAWLPPGGHFNPGMDEIPSDTLIGKIQTEAGAESVVHWAPGLELLEAEDVELHPAPSFVLLEDLTKLPRKSAAEVHTLHYDLNYICRIVDEAVDRVGSGTKPAITIELDSLPHGTARKAEVAARIRRAATAFSAHTHAQVFPDVIERIVLSLDILAGAWKHKLNVFRPNGNGNGYKEIDLVDFPVEASVASNGDEP